MLESLENDAIASARASPCSSPNNLSSSLVDSNHNGCRDTGQPRTKTSERGQSALSKTTHEISNTESLSRQTNPERTKHELKTMQVDKRKFSLELEAITLKGSSQTDQRNISRDSTSSGESRVQKPKVKVVHGSPITRDSAFSPIQKPPRQEQQESQVTHKPDQIQPIIKDGHNDQKESVASSVLVNKIPTVDQNTCKSPKIPTNQLVAGAQTPLTTQSPAFASATQNTLLGQMSPLRLASPQALYPSVNQPLGQPLGAGATVPSFPSQSSASAGPNHGTVSCSSCRPICPGDARDSWLPCYFSRIACLFSRVPCCLSRIPRCLSRVPCCLSRIPCCLSRIPCCLPRIPCL